MIIETTFIKDLLLLTPQVYRDERGYFMESYNKLRIGKMIKTDFVQDNESLSRKDVLRGLHLQLPPNAQAKLIRVIKGSILDVAVDLRRNSETFGQHYKHVLSGENKKQLFIPEGFAHGFLTLEDDTLINYKCSNYYHAESETSILWNDPDLKIDWGIQNPILAEKDLLAEKFITFENPF